MRASSLGPLTPMASWKRFDGKGFRFTFRLRLGKIGRSAIDGWSCSSLRVSILLGGRLPSRGEPPFYPLKGAEACQSFGKLTVILVGRKSD